jgi:GH25 family lysozyme M1 (1,4-beta-N-acetylmuramidase)
MRIADISHFQNKIDWTKMSELCILKCTGGTNYLDPTFKERRQILRNKKLFIGSYHFAGKYVNGIYVPQDPIKEVEWYLKNTEYKEGELFILDWEVQHSDPVNWCRNFWSKFRQVPLMYLNESTFLKYNWPKDWNYWIAKYGTNNGKMQTPPKGDWKLWQFTSRGQADGITGNIDLSYTPLSLPELTGITPPTPPSEPTGGIQKYSQNDERWKNDLMGISNSSLGKFGCTTSAICTIASYFGETLTPKDLASHKELYTKNGLIIWNQLNNILTKLNFLYRYYSFSETVIDDALIKDPNKCVVLNVLHNFHWVAAIKKTNLGYTASDPWSYPAINRNYHNKDIGGFAIFVKK